MARPLCLRLHILLAIRVICWSRARHRHTAGVFGGAKVDGTARHSKGRDGVNVLLNLL